jgi:hypothetical protein
LCGLSQVAEEEGQIDNPLSTEEWTAFRTAMTVALDFMQRNYDEVKVSLVEAEQWSSLACIQQAADSMHACTKDVSPPCQFTAAQTVDSICKILQAHPLLSPCADDLAKWNSRSESLRPMHETLEAHWDDVKAFLITKENWEVLRDLTAARSSMTSSIVDGRILSDQENSMVRMVLKALQELINAGDTPAALQGIAWP